MEMKGKSKKKRKIGKVILIGMGFFLTIVLTFTTTLAWFYDSDWASKYVKMGGTVGIVIKDKSSTTTSGSGNLHFTINSDLAYPGQAVDVSASCYNDGGKSSATGGTGSSCYVRARFAVYTNIGKAPNPDDYITTEYTDGEQNPAYIADKAEYDADTTSNTDLSAESLYRFLDGLITQQNNKAGANYHWVWHQQTGALALSDSGTSTSDTKFYLDGVKYTQNGSTYTGSDGSTKSSLDDIKDRGYFYLCQKTADNPNSSQLYELTVAQSAAFLWDSTFIIPWTLTNLSADKYIYVGVTFQAIQTYIPSISDDGIISGTFNTDTGNQLPASSCTYSNTSVQTVFNTCKFAEIPLSVEIDGKTVNFGSTAFDSFSDRSSLTTNP